IPFPMRKPVARVERHSGYADRGQPNDNRIFHSCTVRMGRNLNAPVIAPVGHQWPSIIAAGATIVDLVAAIWSLLGLPKFPGFRVYREPVTIPVADSEYAGLESGARYERIIGGNAAIIAQPYGFSGIVVWILRSLHL